jgi:hypothetical protein
MVLPCGFSHISPVCRHVTGDAPIYWPIVDRIGSLWESLSRGPDVDSVSALSAVANLDSDNMVRGQSHDQLGLSCCCWIRCGGLKCAYFALLIDVAFAIGMGAGFGRRGEVTGRCK